MSDIDMESAAQALVAWFNSQNLSQTNALALCGMISSAIIRDINSEALWREFLKTLIESTQPHFGPRQ